MQTPCRKRVNRQSGDGQIFGFYRATACNATHGIAKEFLSLRFSVKRIDYDKTKKNLCPHSYTSSFILVF